METVAEAPPISVVLREAPLFAYAAAAIVGTTLGGRLPVVPSVPCIAALLALGLSSGRRWGRCLACAAGAGLLALLSWRAGTDAVRDVDTSRPVRLVGRVTGCWTRKGDRFWSAAFVASWLFQGRHDARHVAMPLRIYLAAERPPRSCGGGWHVAGYLRPPHDYANRPRIAVGGWSIFVKSQILMDLESPPAPLSRLAGRLRKRLFPSGALPEDMHPGERLARALLTGDSGAIPASWREGFRRAGLSHLLAVSGLHLGLVTASMPLLTVRFRRSLRLTCALVVVGFYVLLVGPRASLMRAAAMAAVVAVALLFRRPPRALNALSGAALGLVAWSPAWVGDLGFQLSFGATAGILLMAPRLQPLLNGLPRSLRLSFGATVAAQLATLPWALDAFHRLHPAAPLLNLVAVPWAGAVLLAGFSWATIRLLLPAVAPVFLVPLDLLAAPCSWLAAWGPSSWLSWPVAYSGGIGLAVSLAAWLPLVFRWPRVRSALFYAFLLLAPLVAQSRGDGLEVVLFDVGQGDSILLRDGSHAALIDGGGWRRAGFGGRVVLPALTALGIRRLNAFVVTHPDRDHCGGIEDLSLEIPAAALWTGEGWRHSGCERALARRYAGRHRVLRLGDVGRIGRWHLRVLGPVPGVGGGTNTHSLVLRARAEGHCVLLTGDMDRRAEDALLARWGRGAVRCEILKVAHHGSRSSSGEVWLSAVAPRLALVSVGRHNVYGHPSAKVLAALRRHHVAIARTDREGMLRLSWGGSGTCRLRVEGR